MKLLITLTLILSFLTPISGETLPPSVLYSTLLNGMTMQSDGRLRLSKLTGYFIPKPSTQTGSQYLYNPDDGAALDAVIKNASGETVCVMGAYAMPHDKVAWRFDSFRDRNTKEMDYQFTEAGDYVMEFQIEGKPFQKFPFSVRKVGSDDPYASEELWQLDGDWAEYGYLHIPNASPSSGVAFKMWMQADSPKSVHGSGKIIGPDGSVVATAPEADYRLQTRWARHPFNFRNDAGMLTGAQLTAKPGSYKVLITLDGKTTEYPFTVADSKIVRSGRQAFDSAPIERIEGGRDAWFLKAN